MGFGENEATRPESEKARMRTAPLPGSVKRRAGSEVSVRALGLAFQLLEPDTDQGAARTSRFLVVFPGSSAYTAPGGARFEPREVFDFMTDVDPNYKDSTNLSFATVLYNNGPSPNSELTVRFSDGTTLSGTWPDNGDTVTADDNVLDFEQSMFLTTDE